MKIPNHVLGFLILHEGLTLVSSSSSGSSTIDSSSQVTYFEPQRGPLIWKHMGAPIDASAPELIESVSRQFQRLMSIPISIPVPRPTGVLEPHSGIQVCAKWQDYLAKEAKDPKSPVSALAFLQNLETAAKCVGKPLVLSTECIFLHTVREELGGSFNPAASKPFSISETLSYTGLPHEQRVTATIMLSPCDCPMPSLSDMFEEYLSSRSKEGKSPRVHNSIRVNQRQEQLSISAGGGLDDIYAFSHSNDKTRSIWIIVYVGPSRSIADGRSLIEGFQESLTFSNYVISDSVIMTSDEEEKMEREAEKGDETNRVRNLEELARFALRLRCSGPGMI